ncbi:MAG: DUF354 domain-containing protein [Fibrobacter sp.]|nr:DUF354 domain-containing protein [Fibrobacter sp.]
MPNGNPYILFCAGEDSGDVIGESLVKAVATRCLVKGSGGQRMQNAGLVPLVDFENLPVSGFGDVLPKYFKLRKSFSELKSALESPDCLGLVAIDYPGFNMKLVQLAGKLHKPTLYVAPPQVWAWKRKRAKVLAQNPFVKLAVFFDFEESVYREAGCNVERVQHPFVNSEYLSSLVTRLSSKKNIILLPGSRKAQALRNLPIYLKSVQGTENVVVVAARQELVPIFEKFEVPVVVAPQSATERMALYHSASYAITAPGTATLELALSGVPFTVCTKPDLLTYALGRLFIKTKFFALPNIIMDRLVFLEHIVAPFARDENPIRIASSAPRPRDDVSAELRKKLAVGKTLDELALEFLGQFVECKSQ